MWELLPCFHQVRTQREDGLWTRKQASCQALRSASSLTWDFQTSRTRRNKFLLFTSHQPEKAMATHSSTLAWKILWMEEPGRLQSMGSLRVRHDCETSLSLFSFMYWRRKWQPTPVFLPGESQGRGSLVGCRLWSHRVGHY